MLGSSEMHIYVTKQVMLKIWIDIPGVGAVVSTRFVITETCSANLYKRVQGEAFLETQKLYFEEEIRVVSIERRMRIPREEQNRALV